MHGGGAGAREGLAGRAAAALDSSKQAAGSAAARPALCRLQQSNIQQRVCQPCSMTPSSLSLTSMSTHVGDSYNDPLSSTVVCHAHAPAGRDCVWGVWGGGGSRGGRGGRGGGGGGVLGMALPGGGLNHSHAALTGRIYPGSCLRGRAAGKGHKQGLSCLRACSGSGANATRQQQQRRAACTLAAAPCCALTPAGWPAASASLMSTFTAGPFNYSLRSMPPMGRRTAMRSTCQQTCRHSRAYCTNTPTGGSKAGV